MNSRKDRIYPYIKACKKLIDMPYNKLNIDNYRDIFENAFKEPISLKETYSKSPIQLMSGKNKEAGIIHNKFTKISKPNIYIIGKGVLFDAGGYNLKLRGMENMKTDMAGMAVSFAVGTYLRKELKNNNVISYCPVATNFIHNNGIIPGDHIKIGNKTVEVVNTDAEGRLILAEALTTLELKPNDIVITVATLTGACAYAVGEKATAVMTDNDVLAKVYSKVGKEVGELSWRLPLWGYLQKEFNKRKIKNTSKEKCGTIMGGMFIKQFVKYPKNWIHLDIAYSSYDSKKERATGNTVKTLVKFIGEIE